MKRILGQLILQTNGSDKLRYKNNLRHIYKIHSKQLKRAKWNLVLPLELAHKEYPDNIISLGSSQVIRFIDELNGNIDIENEIDDLKKQISIIKKKPRSKETKSIINKLYSKLYRKQFIEDYVCVIMDSNSDYDRANQGFFINGIKYKRLLGTNGGIKQSTIVYVSERLYPELKHRLDNGRDMSKKLVPAKLEAYQALICSSSIPIPQPKGIIVVKDCITHFKDNVILIREDEKGGEPILTYEDDYDIEHNDSDGYGLMLPEYSRKVNISLTGMDNIISGMNTRYAWTKGMVYTFDFVEFAEKVAGTYFVKDAWGQERDIRNAEVILTVSMLKLWDSYSSWEDYYENCQNNNYVFSTPKTTPDELESVRNTNYQFLQSYDFSDSQLQELCNPTINEVKNVLGLDYRKTLAFLAGFGLNENKIHNYEDSYVKALMIDRRLINDPYVRKSIYSMLKKKIECAKKGSIRINANYVMISGDPYALAESMFGMEVKGLLSAGEVYHKYWINKGANEIVCFRAPMTCHNNIRRMKLNKSDECAKWYEYIKTALIYNAWDTSCDAMNGADKDGDTNMCTDNSILLSATTNARTIMCMQKSAEKTVPTEEEIVASNKLAFNDDIGVVTNHVTSMFEVQAGFEKNSKEYKELEYRIMCGQHYQQVTIDRAKGIIARPMPEYWYSIRDVNKPEHNTGLNRRIVAPHKPYFMMYVYPLLRKKYNKYLKDNELDVCSKFRKYKIKSIKELETYNHKTKEMEIYLDYYEKGKAIGLNPCVVNKICWIFEREFPTYSQLELPTEEFDYTILKCNTEYSRKDYNEIVRLYREYKMDLDNQIRRVSNGDSDNDDIQSHSDMIEHFKAMAYQICPNRYELCDIILDICYRSESSKRFAWEIVPDVIIENLLRKNDYKISFPKLGGNEFEYCGAWFEMVTVEVKEDGDEQQ